jgi:hypothetical protein
MGPTKDTKARGAPRYSQSRYKDPKRDPKRDPDGLGPLDTSGPNIDTTPILKGPKTKVKKQHMEAGQKQRARTLAKKQEEAAAAAAELQHPIHSSSISCPDSSGISELTKQHIESLLVSLNERDIDLQDFLAYIFNKKYNQGVVRWEQFLSRDGAVEELFDNIVNSNKTTDTRVQAWAVQYLGRKVKKEMQVMTDEGTLQLKKHDIDLARVETFDLSDLYATFKEKASTCVELLRCLTTSTRSAKRPSTAREKAQEVVSWSAAIMPSMSDSLAYC